MSYQQSPLHTKYLGQHINHNYHYPIDLEFFKRKSGASNLDLDCILIGQDKMPIAIMSEKRCRDYEDANQFYLKRCASWNSYQHTIYRNISEALNVPFFVIVYSSDFESIYLKNETNGQGKSIDLQTYLDLIHKWTKSTHPKPNAQKLKETMLPIINKLNDENKSLKFRMQNFVKIHLNKLEQEEKKLEKVAG